jgi:hypothetical protein
VLKPGIVLLAGTVLLPISLCAAANAQYLPYAVGYACDDSGKTLLYREMHYCDQAHSHCVIEYIDPYREPLARKQLDYSGSAFAPVVDMQDLRLQSRESARGDEALVIDAGFDNYMRSRWDDLAAGDTVDFPFLALGQDQPLMMQAVSSDGECAGNALCLEVTPGAWLLRLLVEPIRLTYARDSRRLLRYRGISNLSDADGNSPDVDIRYSYGDAGQTESRLHASTEGADCPAPAGHGQVS